MSLFRKLLGIKTEPPKRIRICVECGMPVAEHKSWCSILRGQRELDEKAALSTANGRASEPGRN